MSDLLLARRAQMARHSLLPREYQQVEYIESTGTQWIDTGVYPVITSTYKIQALFCPTDISGEQYLIGADSNNDVEPWRSRLTCAGWYQGRFLFGWGGWSQGSNLSANTWYRLSASYKNGEQLIDLNDSYFSTAFTQTAPFLSTIKIGNAHIVYQHRVLAKISNITITVDDTIVRDFIPCYRKQSSEVGMFDRINRLFYSSATIPFLCGPEIY